MRAPGGSSTARGSALTLALAVLSVLSVLAPSPAAGRPVQPALPERVETTSVDRVEQRRERQDAERAIALASTWRADPALLQPLRTDSEATAAARRQLAVIDARFAEAMAAYDEASAAADVASSDARAARETLARARGAALAAGDRYRADRELLVDVLTEASSVDSLGSFVRAMTADTHEDLSRGLVALQQMGRSQADHVLAAERSLDELRLATDAVAAAVDESTRAAAVARRALDEATSTRDRVLADLRQARSLLRDAALADQLAAQRREATWGVEHAVFPLPDTAPFVDLDNWGRRGRNWANVHTGDDFSAACGTPVLAATDGTVLVRTDQRWSGRWLVMISTGPGELSTWYAHMQSLAVTAGTLVRAGQPIGSVGAEGNATGCHLHLEVHPDGGSIYEDHIDPAAWLQDVDAYPG